MKSHFLKKLSLLACVLMILSPSAFPNDTSRNQEIAERFAKCDKNHDGKLTKEEAKGCMPRIYDHFSYIDSDGNGYVTVTEIQAMASR
jgi:Ca2+-binding EF-hand superfamily protein